MNLDAHTVSDIIGVLVLIVGIFVKDAIYKTRQSAQYASLEKEVARMEKGVTTGFEELRRTLDKWGERLGIHEREDAAVQGSIKTSVAVLESRLARDEDSWEGMRRDIRDSERSRRNTLVGHEGT